MIEIYIRELAFLNLINGTKKYELRLQKGIFNKLSRGDTVLLCYNTTKIKKTINNLYRFKSFLELFENLGLNNCLTDCTDIKGGEKYMKTIYSESLQKKYSCLALEFI